MTFGSGLNAGKVIPVRVTDPNEKEHRRLLGEAVNHVAAAAFTPYTQQIQVEDVDFEEDPGADLGLTISVTPYIPARAHVLLILQVVNGDAMADLNATVEIKENGVTIADLANAFVATGGGMSEPLMLQILSDLEPNTTYTYTVIATEGAGESGLAASGSSLSVRLESRIVA